MDVKSESSLFLSALSLETDSVELTLSVFENKFVCYNI